MQALSLMTAHLDAHPHCSTKHSIACCFIMPIHMHQSCCVARALNDDPQDRCFERPELFDSHEIVAVSDEDEYDVTLEQEPGRAIDWSTDVGLALGETKEMADCLWDTLKPYPNPDDLPPPYVACCRTTMGPQWKEKYGQIRCKSSVYQCCRCESRS